MIIPSYLSTGDTIALAAPARKISKTEILPAEKWLASAGFNVFYDDRLFLNELFPLKKYEFEGEYFYGPNNYDVFLTRCYGKYMELPPEEKRHPHYSQVIFL